jgi:hypothetical protein
MACVNLSNPPGTFVTFLSSVSDFFLSYIKRGNRIEPAVRNHRWLYYVQENQVISQEKRDGGEATQDDHRSAMPTFELEVSSAASLKDMRTSNNSSHCTNNDCTCDLIFVDKEHRPAAFTKLE